MKSKKQISFETKASVFTRKEFEEYVEDGCFIPYDGIGYFHDGINRTNISVWDKNITSKDAKKYPYVCWYNR